MKLRTSFQAVLIASDLIFSACNRKAASENVARINQNKGRVQSYQNNAYKVNTKIYGSPTLLALIEVYSIEADSVSIKIRDNYEGELNYKDYKDLPTELRMKVLEGRLSKKGYIVVFLSNKRTEIPPFFPIIYSRVNVNRLRLSFTQDGNLVMDNKWNRSGNIFLLGAGEKGRRKSYFHKIY
jgi:hypothetical protein